MRTAPTETVRDARARGVTNVTCEVAPHHFVMTDESLETPVRYDTNTKMNPPLREAADRDAMRDGIADGTVDVIATDHAPHAVEDKECEWAYARPGMLGLETALSVVQQTMVDPGAKPPPRMRSRSGSPVDSRFMVIESRSDRCLFPVLRSVRGHTAAASPRRPVAWR